MSDENINNFDLAAAEWRRQSTDEKAYVEALAVRLQKALPNLVTVDRYFSFFSKNPPIRCITVRFDDAEYQLTYLKNGVLIPEIGSIVRNIRLKTDRLEFVEWLSRLSQALSKYSSQHSGSREALERFLFS